MRVSGFNLVRLVSAVIVAAFLAGCGKNPAKPLAAQPQATQDLSPQVESSVATQAATIVLGGGPLAAAKSLLFMSAPRGAMSSRSALPSRVGAIMTDSTIYSYEIHAYDANGTEVPWSWSASEAIARVTIAWNWYADFAENGNTSIWRSSGTYDFTGLAASEPRLVANCVQADTLAIHGVEVASISNIDWKSRVTADHVAWEKSGTPGYPVAGTLGGTYACRWDGIFDGTRTAGTYDVAVLITMNGTQIADIIVNGHHYTVDLVTGAVLGPLA